MKRNGFCIALVLVAGIALAASPQEESRFLKAIREAFAKKDGRAIVSLTCFDQVEAAIAQAQKAYYSTNYPFLPYKVSSVEYEAPDPIPSPTGSLEGKPFKLNLSVVKKIKIVYDTRTNTGKCTQTLPVGEKDGKLFLPQTVAPQVTNSTPHP